MNRVSRLAVVALLTGTTALVAGTQQASAAVTDRGSCHGEIVKTCIELQVNGSEARAVATIRDEDGGTNFDVDATHAILQSRNPVTGDWENVRFHFDPGWVSTRDQVVTSSGSCGGHGTRDFRAVGHYKWRNPAGVVVSDSMETSSQAVPCRP